MLKHQHFGKLRAHQHTSYAGLLFVLAIMAVLLFGTSWAAQAAPPAVNPQSGSVGLAGTVPGPAPSTAAVILTPADGSHTSSIPITVSGTCPAGTFVNVMKNNVFGGAVVCEANGTFSLLVDLFDGVNTLVARVVDGLGQFGPDSRPVTVTYDAPNLNLSGGQAGKQLFLDMTRTVVGGAPDEAIARTVTIVGGVGPYAMSWDFGDDTSSLQSQASEGAVTMSHRYDRSGIYRVIVRVTDSVGNSAFLQFVTVVNGPIEALGSNRGLGLGALPGALVAAWPVLGLAGLMVLFFWLGERRQDHKLRRRYGAVG